jgi:transposase
LYAERIEEERNKFKQVLETLNPADLVYIDECGLQESLWREYARSPIGERILTDIRGKRESRTSIIAGLHQGEPLAPMMFDGYCNTEVVKEWVKEMLLPELKPGQIVIWDNASFHQSPQFTELIESVDCKLLYLPIYSPDLNPIEKWWAKLKAWIRRLRTRGMALKQALVLAFQKMSNKISG